MPLSGPKDGSRTIPIKFLAGTIKRRAGKAVHLAGMKPKTGAPRVAPSLKSLYAEARILRDNVLRRILAGYAIDEASLLDARAIVMANIGALVAAAEFEILLGYPPGETRMLALLVQSCEAEIADTIGLSVRKRRDVRLVADP
jgi:hypothetical protein